MKFYYAISILMQLFKAVLFNDENKKAYMLHLWKNLAGGDQAGSSENRTAGNDYAIDKCLAIVALAAASILGSMVS